MFQATHMLDGLGLNIQTFLVITTWVASQKPEFRYETKSLIGNRTLNLIKNHVLEHPMTKLKQFLDSIFKHTLGNNTTTPRAHLQWAVMANDDISKYLFCKFSKLVDTFVNMLNFLFLRIWFAFIKEMAVDNTRN